MRRYLMFTLFVVICLTLALGAYAITTPAGGTVTESNEGTLNGTGTSSLVAQGGNVSTLNIETNVSTSRWQGFAGNVTGNLSLARGADIFYNFGSAAIDTVFATTESGTYDWANLEAGAAADVDTVWSFSAGSDQAVDAFTGSGTFEGIGSVPFVTLGNFQTAIFDESTTAAKADFAFGANVTSAGAAGFDGASYQYQLMVPTTTGGTDTYYFYVSLDE